MVFLLFEKNVGVVFDKMFQEHSAEPWNVPVRTKLGFEFIQNIFVQTIIYMSFSLGDIYCTHFFIEPFYGARIVHMQFNAVAPSFFSIPH